MLRLACVGTGSIGRRHIANLVALGCAVAAYDLSADALNGVPAGASRHLFALDAFPITEYDAVVIATPWDQHLALVELAVETRTPFFVEKPLGSLEQLPRWREIAALDLPVNQCGYMLRFHPKAQALKLLFPKPSVGACVCEFDMRTWPGVYGPMFLEASHEIDMALWLGAPANVSEVVQRHWWVEVWLDDGWRSDAGRRDHTARHHGAVGGGCWSVTLADERPYSRLWSVEGGGEFDNRVAVEFNSPEALGTEMYHAELAHFLDCVREQKPTRVPLADGLRVLEVCAHVEALCPSSR